MKDVKVDIYHLTISGLSVPVGYPLLVSMAAERAQSGSFSDRTFKRGEKAHTLFAWKVSARYFGNLGLRFLSFKKGHRPDVLDVDQSSLQPSPLAPDQTGVEWSHALIGPDPRREGKFLLLLERNFQGIHPGTLEFYLQWYLHKFSPLIFHDMGEPVVSITAEPGAEFIERIEAMDQVTKATLRIVKPNPSWEDLESELAATAQDSGARRVDVEMAARRGTSLRKDTGIVAWIKQKFFERDLDLASLTGRSNGKSENVSSDKLGRRLEVKLETDERGQVVAVDAWAKLAELLKGLD